MVNFAGGHTPHPEINTNIRNREDYPQSLWEHPEPDYDEVINLGDEGLSDGDVIDGYFANYLGPNRRVEIPEGEYVWERSGYIGAYPDMHLVGLGGLGDVRLDQGGQSGRVNFYLESPGVCVIEGIDVVGYATYRHDHGVSAQDPDAELIFKRYRVRDGVNPTTSSNRGSCFYMNSIRDEDGDDIYDGHSGTMRFLWCQWTRSPDNNCYADGPITVEEANGQVIWVGGESRFGNISIVRMGHHGATMYGTRITATGSTSELPGTGDYFNQRGIWVRQPRSSEYDDYDKHTPSENVIDECEFYFPDNAGSGGLFVIGPYDHQGSGVITRCRMENHSSAELINYASGDFSVYDCHAYGSGDLGTDLTFQGDSEIGSGADHIDTEPWWGLEMKGISPPQNLGVTDADSDSITVNWDPPINKGDGLDHYDVYVDGTFVKEVGSGTTATTVQDLEPDTSYTIGVAAVDTAGDESRTVEITASTDNVISGTVPIGGGDGYPYTFTEDEADLVASTHDGLLSSLDSAGVGDVVFLDGDASVDLSSGIRVPSGVTLASDRGVDGSDGGLIFFDSDVDEGSIIEAGPGARVTGLRVRGPLDDSQTWDSLQNPVGGIEATDPDVEIDNCEVWAVSYGLIDGLDSFAAHHNHVHHCNDTGAGYGIWNDGANSPYPQYTHNLIEHCSVPIEDSDDGGYTARHNVIRGPVREATIQQGINGGATTVVRNNTVEVAQAEQDSSQVPNVQVTGVPSDILAVEKNHLYNPDPPNDPPSAGDDDHAIVQIDIESNEHVTSWENVEYSDNHYGTTDPPEGVGAIPLGDPDTIGRPRNLSVTEYTASSVDLSWDPPEQTGAGVKEYAVYVDGVRRTTRGAASTDITIGNLEPDTFYLFEVTAIDDNDVESFPSSVTRSTRTADVTAPRNVTVASTTSSSIAIEWDEPETVGAGIDRYNVYIEDRIDHTVNAPTTETTLQGLESSESYTLGVSAVDADGEESSRTTVNAVTDEPPEEAPEPPAVIYTAGSASTRIAVGVSEPSDTGSAPLSHYRLFIDGDFDRNVSRAEDYILVTQLEPETTYTIGLSAVNEDGLESRRLSISATTRARDATHGGTPIGPDDPSCGFGDIASPIAVATPQNLTVATTSSTSASLTWDPPEEDVDVDHYNIYVDNSFEIDVDGTEATVRGLSSETEYEFAVTAVDENGNESTKAQTTGETYPSPDVSVQSVVHTAIEVAWTEPADVGNIERYHVYLDGAYHHRVDSEFTSTIVPHLAEGTEYTVGIAPVVDGTERDTDSVTATTDTGDWTDYTIDPPENIKAASPDEETVEIAWNEPPTTLDMPYYLIGENGNVEQDLVEVQPRTSRHTSFDGLSSTETYEFAVAGIVYFGAVGDPATIVTGTTGSNPPQNVAFPDRGSNHVDITWDPPEN